MPLRVPAPVSSPVLHQLVSVQHPALRCAPLGHATQKEPPFDVEKADLEKALHEQQPAVTEQFAKNVQAKAKGWKAGNPEWAANLSMSEAKHLMGHIDDPTLERVPEDSLGAFAGSGMPESFDTREAWPKCKEIISHVRDQGALLGMLAGDEFDRAASISRWMGGQVSGPTRRRHRHLPCADHSCTLCERALGQESELCGILTLAWVCPGGWGSL